MDFKESIHEGGQYNYIFLSRLYRSTLESFFEQIEDDQKEKVLELNLVGCRCYLKTKSELGDAEFSICMGISQWFVWLKRMTK